MAEVLLNIVVEAFCWLFDWGRGREQRREARHDRKPGASHE